VGNKLLSGLAWWYIPIIPDTQEVEVGGFWFKARLDKVI
jgi:hypothetical protein